MNISAKFILSITILLIIIISLVIFTTLSRQRSIIIEKMQRKGFVLKEVLAMASVNAFLNYDYSTLKRYMDTVLTGRKPMLLFSLYGLLLFRLAHCKLLAELFQLPPRFKRFVPVYDICPSNFFLNLRVLYCLKRPKTLCTLCI